MSSASGFGQPVLITEIMAENKGVLLDADGDSSDWIELYNATDAPINLGGWNLTDSQTDLTKWTFPATNIAAKTFLVVFASDKDRAVAGAELHTNFKLSASGEYVALVRPDGTTIADAHTFPAQSGNISYGYPSTRSALAVVLDAGAACTAKIPVDDSDADAWQLVGFDDATWLEGTTGVGYEAGKGYQNLIGLDVLAMRNNNQSVYVRVPFQLEDPSSVTGMTLKMKYDDGFIAYLNGTRVAASRAPANASWDSGATANHNDGAAVVFEEIDLSGHVASLQPGANVLAIHGLNRGLGSSDLLVVPRLEVKQSSSPNTSISGFLETPTPGAANVGVSYEGQVQPVVATPERGFYETPIQVTLTNATEGATIRYTLDSSDPTPNSTPYTGPITISSTANLRARAFREGWKPSPPRTDTYIFVDDVVKVPRSAGNIGGQTMIYGMDQAVVATTYHDADNQPVTVQDALTAIPTISVTTDNANLYDPATGIYVNAAQRWEVPASVELINPDGSAGFHINAGLRIRGGWSRHDNYPKHAFRLFFRGEYGESKLRYPLFGDEGADTFDKIDLRTSQNYNWAKFKDSRNTFLRDIFCRDSAGAMGAEYARSRYYHLYLNGQYWGLFMTEERPVADFGASYFGGDKEDYDAIKTTSWVDGGAYDVEATDGNLDAYNRLYNAAMKGFANTADYFAVQGLDASGQPDPGKECLLDRDNLIDYLLLIYYAGASDNCITKFLGGNQKLNNLYAVFNRANPDGFKWVQHDCEHAFDTSTDLDRTGPFNHSNFTQARYFNAMTLHAKLSANPEYRLAFADRVYKHFSNGGALVQTNCEARLDARAAEIDRAIVANAARWGNTRLDRDTWVSAVAKLRRWFAGRVNTVIGYLRVDGLIPSILPPTLDRLGGEVPEGTRVSISAAEGTVYYTTDGSDPRAIGGAPAGDVYSSPVPITKPTHLKARARKSDGEWSALVEGVFWTTNVPLAITELMYHAPGGNDQDFIELQNISDEPVSLRGYEFDQAIHYRFDEWNPPTLAPGEHILVVEDIDEFNAAHPAHGARIAGEYRDDFDNSGEEVVLEFRNQNLISFRYSDARNWPQAADGAGHSLVPVESAIPDQGSGSLNYGGNWRASTYAGGSPGQADPAPGMSVRLNEITAHTDTGLAPPYDSNDQIELYNPSDTDAVLNGWWLSDDPDDLTQWAIPNGTTVPAHGFVLFDEGDFHPSPMTGFGINKAGEQVFLSSPNGVVDAIRFKGQANGESLGRYPDGAADWVVTLPTPAAANQPVPATVQISELMYHPLTPPGHANGDMVEYIQLKNLSASAVLLETTAGAWRIDGGVSYTFPAGTALPAGGHCWLVPFDPTADPTLLNLFRDTYGLTAANETFFGPYQGQLSNEGERVAVELPQESDDPTAPLDRSWIVVDEVFYFDQSPWPEGADGTGYPLKRTGLTSWIAPSASDTDGDGMPDAWERDHFGSLDQDKPDWDGDGLSNVEEYICGTNPTDPASYFAITREPGAISWTSVEGRVYSVYRTDDLQKPFTRVASGIVYPQGSYQIDGPDTSGYFRIEVEMQ